MSRAAADHIANTYPYAFHPDRDTLHRSACPHVRRATIATISMRGASPTFARRALAADILAPCRHCQPAPEES